MASKEGTNVKDLQQLARECLAELESIGISCGRISRWTVNTRAKTRWGMCKKLSDGTFEIEIAAVLLRDEVSDLAAKNTVIHELLHTVPGCSDHGSRWKALATAVNEKLPGYAIRRTTSFAEKGLTGEQKKPVYRYILRCSQCGRQILRQKRSAVVEHPERYRCSCGGRLILL